MKRDPATIRCELCGRQVSPNLVTQHHLTPRERGGKAEHKVPLCSPCHKQIHALFDNKHLEANLADIERLRKAPELQKFIRWVRKQPGTSNVTTRQAGIRSGRRMPRR